MFTRNTITCVEKRYWSFVEDRLRALEIEFLSGPVYESNNGYVRDYMFFSMDNGTVNKDIMNTIGGQYEHTIDGERVA